MTRWVFAGRTHPPARSPLRSKSELVIRYSVTFSPSYAGAIPGGSSAASSA